MLEFLRGDSKSQRDAHESTEVLESDVGDGSRKFYCRRCDQWITDARSQVEVNGQHRHMQINPSGTPFDIGCFATAPGTHGHGGFDSYWTWFPGYAWQVTLCRGCAVHLGWRFRNDDGDGFFGLMVNRVIERESDQQ